MQCECRRHIVAAGQAGAVGGIAHRRGVKGCHQGIREVGHKRGEGMPSRGDGKPGPLRTSGRASAGPPADAISREGRPNEQGMCR